MSDCEEWQWLSTDCLCHFLGFIQAKYGKYKRPNQNGNRHWSDSRELTLGDIWVYHPDATGRSEQASETFSATISSQHKSFPMLWTQFGLNCTTPNEMLQHDGSNSSWRKPIANSPTSPCSEAILGPYCRLHWCFVRWAAELSVAVCASDSVTIKGA